MDIDRQKSDAAEAGSKRGRWARRIALGICLVLVLAAAGFGLYVSDYYHADDAVEQSSDEMDVPVSETDAYIAVGKREEQSQESSDQIGIVLYPGAKVDPHAYIPLARKIAQQGYLCIVTKPLFNLAFFDIDGARRAMEDNPGISSWWLAGHSLGGVAAAQFASAHADEVDGLVLLASYSAADLSKSDLAVLTLVGEKDEVINWTKLDESLPNLPEAYRTTIVLAGGNHAGFGSYGPQEGDGAASISAEEQQDETAAAIAGFIESGGNPEAAMASSVQDAVNGMPADGERLASEDASASDGSDAS